MHAKKDNYVKEILNVIGMALCRPYRLTCSNDISVKLGECKSNYHTYMCHAIIKAT